jgi:hypothetical protein
LFLADEEDTKMKTSGRRGGRGGRDNSRDDVDAEEFDDDDDLDEDDIDEELALPSVLQNHLDSATRKELLAFKRSHNEVPAAPVIM